jgi:hypothetical protein
MAPRNKVTCTRNASRAFPVHAPDTEERIEVTGDPRADTAEMEGRILGDGRDVPTRRRWDGCCISTPRKRESGIQRVMEMEMAVCSTVRDGSLDYEYWWGILRIRRDVMVCWWRSRPGPVPGPQVTGYRS